MMSVSLGRWAVRMRSERLFSTVTTWALSGRKTNRGVYLPAFWYASRNFGDALVPDLVASLAHVRPFYSPASGGRRLVALGSIAEHIGGDDVVWGTGSLGTSRLCVSPQVQITAVRGPRTAALISGTEVPHVYGDPAQLVPEIYRPRQLGRRWSLGIVPHYVDLPHLRSHDPSIQVINPLWPWPDVVDHIASCDELLSSSLHGIIVAEAYRVPVRWSRLTGEISGGNHKFFDYLEATGRDAQEAPALGDLARGVGVSLPAGRFANCALREALIQAVRLSLRSSPSEM